MGARNWPGIGLWFRPARARICKRLWSPVIDFPNHVSWRVGTKNRVVVPSRQAGNRFLVSLKGLRIRATATQPGGIGSLNSIHGFFEGLKIRAQGCPFHPKTTLKMTDHTGRHEHCRLCTLYSVQCTLYRPSPTHFNNNTSTSPWTKYL
jgi:hypothetical protein